MNNLELRKLLLKLGIHSNLEGYHYIIDAYEIISKQKIHTNVTTIYQMIADKVGKNAGAVERGIRHSIQKCYKNGRLNKIYYKLPDNSVLLYDLYFNFDVLVEELKGDIK